jgi:hypothetical protein
VPQLVGVSVPFFLFGAFWLGTLKLGWPALLEHRPRTRARRVAATVVTCLVVLCLDVVMTLGSAAMGSSLFSPDCSAIQPVTKPKSPSSAVFTARAILVGRSIAELEHEKEVERLNGFRPVAEYRYGFGEWAIAVVQDRFWGIDLGQEDCHHRIDRVEEGSVLRRPASETTNSLSVSDRIRSILGIFSGGGRRVLETLGFESESQPIS